MTYQATFERFAVIEARKAGLNIATYATRFALVVDQVESGSFGERGQADTYGSDAHIEAVQRLRAKLADVYSKIVTHRATLTDGATRPGSES